MALRHRLRALVERVAPAYIADRAVKYEIAFRERHGITEAGRRFIAELGDRVLRGPFEGLRYWAEGDAPVMKLAGAYEAEIAGWIDDALAGSPPTFVDVGAADGYYAVGTKLRHPEVRVHAFELSPTARDRLAHVAALNDVALDAVRGAGDARAISEVVEPGGLLLCDIEGAEMQLFDPELVRALSQTTVIVELHEALSPGVTQALRARFGATHEVDIVATGRRDAQRFPELEEFTEASDETRGADMAWARFRPLT